MVGLLLSMYNGEKYIYDQMESIRCQTEKIDHVVIVDDCSSDNGVIIVKDYIERNSLGWKLIENYSNKGWMRNFLDNIALLDDDYIFFCDQDDVWNEEKVKDTIFAINAMNALVVCCNYKLIYSDMTASRDLEKEQRKLINDEKILKVKQKPENFYIRRPGCSMCVTREAVNIAKPFLKCKHPHDAIFWKIALVEDRLYIINKPLLYWRRHGNNASTGRRSRKGRLSGLYDELEFAKSLNTTYPDGVLVNEYHKQVCLRYELFQRKKIMCWIRLFWLRKYYVSCRSYLGDLYLCFFSK